MSAPLPYGSVFHHRLSVTQIKTRRLCRLCPCRKRGTHAVFANGICMTAPACEMSAHRWAKKMSRLPSLRKWDK